MSAARDVPHEGPPRSIAARTRWWWSVRRELWESRSIVVAPVVVAALVFIGFVVRSLHGADLRRAGVVVLGGAVAIDGPAQLVALLVVVTVTLVGLLYCADALHRERSDRSVLFWKSLPVSDVVAVLAKASIPGIVLPLLAFAVIVVTQATMYVCATIVDGRAAAGPLLPLLQLQATTSSGLVVFTLWYAPVYAWLLFVSSWARRLTLGMAVLPWIVAAFVERLAFDTAHVVSLLTDRLFEFGPSAIVFGTGLLPTPVRLLASPALWIGLVVAAALIAATVAMRRRMPPL